MISSTNFNKTAMEIREQMDSNGFHLDVEKGTALMLTVSELSEALEALRKDRRADITNFDTEVSTLGFQNAFKAHIKDTFEDEMADALIRILDMCAKYNIDIDFHVKQKMLYNSQRPYKHGKSF